MLFRESSHSILNLLTLQIKDKEIERKLDESRSENFKRAFWPVLIFTIGIFIYYLVNFLNGKNTTPSILIGTSIHLSLLFLWFIMRKRFKNWTPKITTLFLAIQCVMADLSLYNKLPDFLIESDSGGLSATTKILISFIAS